MYQIALGARKPVQAVQGPGNGKMTILHKDAEVCGDSVIPDMATYEFLFCHYGGKRGICTKKSLNPGTPN